MKLRDYQQKAIDDIRNAIRTGNRRVLFQCPTGGGKTIISSFMMKSALEKGLKVLFLVHLKELINQTSGKIASLELSHGIIAAHYDADLSQPCQLAMVATLSRRLKKIDFRPDIVIVDEAHHTISNTYLELLEKFDKPIVVGLTATPERLDGKGMGLAYDIIVPGPSMKMLQERGFLSRYRYHSVPFQVDLEHKSLEEANQALEEAGILGDCVEHYNEKIPGKKAIVFCASVAHSISIAERFNRAGIEAAHLDGTTPPVERTRIVEGFASGQIKVLSNCSLLAEGFDVPDCEGVFILRPTKSLVLFLQMVGRGLRPSGDDTHIFDHVGAYLTHGLPCDDRKWSLLGKKERKKINKEIQAKVCENCFSVYNNTHQACPHCSFKPVPVARNLKTKETSGKLVEISGFTLEVRRSETGALNQQDVRHLLNKCLEDSDYYRLAAKLGYKRGWAMLKIKERNEKQKRASSTKTISY